MTKRKTYSWLRILKNKILYIIKDIYNFMGIDMMQNVDLPRGEFMDTRNGEKIIVRDNLIDNDQMILMTSKGQIPLEEFSKYYIQVSNDIYDENGKKIGKAPDGTEISPTSIRKGTIDINEAKKHVFDFNDLDDGTNDEDPVEESPTTMSQGMLEQVKPLETTKTTYTKDVDIDSDALNKAMLKKLFEKSHYKPVISVELSNIDEFPINELKMMVDSFGLSIEDAASYIATNMISSEYVRDCIAEFLKYNLYNDNDEHQ